MPEVESEVRYFRLPYIGEKVTGSQTKSQELD